MYVKIDTDITENILKAYARRSRDQLRVYGILLGTLEGKDTYHIKSCIYGYIYESKENDGSEENSTVEFKRLNDTITNSLFTSYQSNFPNYMILGGFSTDKDLFMELFYLYNTINDLNTKTLQNKNKILVMVDPWHKNEKSLDYGISVYNWKFEEDSKVMSYKKIPHLVVDSKVVGSILHSNLLNKEEMLLNLQKSSFEEGNLSEIMEEIRKSVDSELKYSHYTNQDSVNNMNLHNIKKQLLLTERFLLIIENYLNSSDNFNENDEIIHQVDYVLQELTSYFERDDVLKIVHQEFRQNQIIDALGNLLNLQIKITEKINNFNI